MDGSAASNSRTHVAAFARSRPEPLRQARQCQPQQASSARRPQRALLSLRSAAAYAIVSAALPHEMEWHMKRLCHRCGVRIDRIDANTSRPLRPERDWIWMLLWRENQRHRPPSNR
jgi:hypothetical protein